jgi:hypothetical protein
MRIEAGEAQVGDTIRDASGGLHVVQRLALRGSRVEATMASGLVADWARTKPLTRMSEAPQWVGDQPDTDIGSLAPWPMGSDCAEMSGAEMRMHLLTCHGILPETLDSREEAVTAHDASHASGPAAMILGHNHLAGVS